MNYKKYAHIEKIEKIFNIRLKLTADIELFSSVTMVTDLEWLTGSHDGEAEGMTVDIGYLPEMELSADHSKGMRGVDVGCVWKEELSAEDVKGRLERAMYPFKQVKPPEESIITPPRPFLSLHCICRLKRRGGKDHWLVKQYVT